MSGDGVSHVVDRMNVFDDLISLYMVECEKMLSDYSLRVNKLWTWGGGTFSTFYLKPI